MNDQEYLWPELVETAQLDFPDGSTEQALRDYLLSFGDFEGRIIETMVSAIKHVTEGKPLHELEKSHKAVVGPVWQDRVRKNFQLETSKKAGKGVGKLDFKIPNTDIRWDIKFTMGSNWMIPQECVDQICLLGQYSESEGKIRVGTFWAREMYLNQGLNQDKKRTISKEGKTHIHWLVDVEIKPIAA